MLTPYWVYTHLTVWNMFLLVELTDICRTITSRLKESSFLLRKPPSVKYAAFQRMRCLLLCSSALTVYDAVSSHCLPFTHACNESEYVDFWKPKWGYRKLWRGAALRCCALSSVGGACQLSGRATQDICGPAAALCFFISTNFTMGWVPYLRQPLKRTQWKV